MSARQTAQRRPALVRCQAQELGVGQQQAPGIRIVAGQPGRVEADHVYGVGPAVKRQRDAIAQ
jgi:hypothetical protein